MVAAYIGLGGNLGAVEKTLRAAVADLAQLPGSQLTGTSSLFRSAPLGPNDQPDYLNAVVRLATTLTPHRLLEALQAIESRHGRVRLERWGPRTLDLDLLLYGQDRISSRDLIVPHPELGHRSFVLVPLLQLDPDLCGPDGVRLATLPPAKDRGGLTVQADRGWAIDASR